MDELDESFLKVANEAKKKILESDMDATPDILRKNSSKLEGKKVKGRTISPRAAIHISIGMIALSYILMSASCSMSEEDLYRKRGGYIEVDHVGNVTKYLPEGVEKPTRLEIITNILDVIKQGLTRGGR